MGGESNYRIFGRLYKPIGIALFDTVSSADPSSQRQKTTPPQINMKMVSSDRITSEEDLKKIYQPRGRVR